VIEELATHISLLAAPVYAALISRAPPGKIGDDAWQEQARTIALALARELWHKAITE